MSETNIENNMISEEDLEKAAGGLKITKNTLKKALLAAGALAIAGVGGYYICKNGSKKGPEKMIVKSLSEEQYDQMAAEDEFVDNYFEDDENFI
ncbi:MAG: hypothetical protein Q4B93_03335 [Clostridia bacterium]|nr:hypothetical protein [Clostridia bacterium]